MGRGRGAAARALVEQWLDWNQCRLSPVVIDIVLNTVFMGENGDQAAAQRGREALPELAGVLEATVAAMADLGAAPDTVYACVGPAIAQASYEVGPEFPAPFLEQDPDNTALFRPGARAGHALFDLAGYAARRLGALGLAGVAVLDHDTYRDAGRFFSYRRGVHRDEPAYGRGLSAIALAP